MITTLNKLYDNDYEVNNKAKWNKLLRRLGGKKTGNEPVSIITILNINGYEDALKAMKAVDGYDKELRLFAVRCSRRVQHLMTEPLCIVALDVAERFANGEATIKELDAAWLAARDAIPRVKKTSADRSALSASCIETRSDWGLNAAGYCVRSSRYAAIGSSRSAAWAAGNVGANDAVPDDVMHKAWKAAHASSPSDPYWRDEHHRLHLARRAAWKAADAAEQAEQEAILRQICEAV